MAVVLGESVLRLVRVPPKLFHEGALHFLKSVVREHNHSGTGQRQLGLRAGTQESGQRNRAILRWRLLEQGSQTGRDAMSDKGIVIAPKVNPGRGLNRDLIDQILGNRKMALAKTFLSDRVCGGIEKAA